MTPVLLVCHGELAQGLISAVSQIMGPQPELQGLSNRGLSPELLQQKIREWLHPRSEHAVLLVDFPGSSCYRAAMRAVRASGQQATVVSGVNLGMLLSFLSKRGELAPENFGETLVNDGSRGLLADG